MSVKAGTHYPCSRAVSTAREHGSQIFDTRDHGPCSRVIFLTPVWYYWSPWTRAVLP